MSLLDLLIGALLTFVAWWVFRALVGAHEVIPGVNEPPRAGWHPPHREPAEGFCEPLASPVRGMASAAIVSLAIWGLIWLALRVIF
jgi:hypothetical protein